MFSHNSVFLHFSQCNSFLPCGVSDDPGGGGARQTRVGGDGEAENAVQLDLQTKKEELLIHQFDIMSKKYRSYAYYYIL